MATLEELVIELSADTKGLQADMKAASLVMEKSTNEMRKSIEAMSKGGSKDTNFLQTAFATMTGFIGSQAVLGVFNTVKDTLADLFKDGINGAIEAQTAFTAFSQALVSTGKYTKEAANSFRDFADEQQNLTGISAEAYLSTGKLLTTMAGLSGPVLKDATRSIADLSTLMGKDMDGAARLFSRGVETSTEVFKKFGLTIENGSTKAERAANIIEALNSKFGGSATSQAKTYDGALTILKKSFGEVTESAGALVVENLALVQVMNTMSEIFIKTSNDMTGNSEGLKESIASLTAFFFDLAASITQTTNEFVGMANSFWKFITLASEAEVDSIENMSPTLTSLEDNFRTLSGAATAGLSNMQAGGDVTTAALTKTVDATKLARAELTAYQQESKDFAISLAESANTQAEIYQMDTDLLASQFEAKLLTEEEYLIQKEALQATYMEQEQAMLDSAIANKLIKGEAAQQAQLALVNKQAIAEYNSVAARTKFDEDNQKKREANLASSLTAIASLSSSSNKELAAIGKAAAIYQATIDGYAAVQKALASAPPPFNFGIAAAVGIATVANISKIAGTPLATGIDSVPGIGSNDNFPAVLAPNERVVPSKTNEDLTAFLASQSSQPRSSININISMHDIFSSDPKEMGMKLIDTINEAAQANGVTILGSTIS